jgi:aspartate racemase
MKFIQTENYRDRLKKKYGLQVIVLNETEREYINSVIFNELCANVIRNQSKERFKKIINCLADEE